jgi:hypothetical protein
MKRQPFTGKRYLEHYIQQRTHIWIYKEILQINKEKNSTILKNGQRFKWALHKRE